MEVKYTTEKLTKTKLKNINFEDVIYGERSQGGAMGNAGGIILYIFDASKMTRYEANIMQDEKTAVAALKQITLNEEMFNLFYGGMGNGVFINKKQVLSVDLNQNCYWLNHNNKKYRIDPSVPGVLMATAKQLNGENPPGLSELHESWEQSLRDHFLNS